MSSNDWLPNEHPAVTRRTALAMLAGGIGATAQTGGETKPDFSRVPGVVIAHSPQSSGIYLSSPNIVRMRNGSYLAKCDEFGPGSTENTAGASRVYRSTDRGLTWQLLTRVPHMYWSTTFEHRDALYMIGSNSGREDRRLSIRKSTDGGAGWSDPGGARGYLETAVPMLTNASSVVEHRERIWFGGAADVLGPPGWGSQSRFKVMSAASGADLLDPSSWTFSTPIAHNPTFLDGKFGGLIEGTIVAGPDGLPTVLYRVDYREGPEEKALIARASLDGKLLGFDSRKDIIDFPGGCKKFIVRFDPLSRFYWSLTNWVPQRHKSYNPERARNTLALIRSSDLYRWTIRTVVLHHPDTEKHGFHYVDFLFEGEDMVAVSRTAFDDGLGGAHNQHDSNFLTFHRFAHFRELAPRDAPDELAPEIVAWNARFAS